MKNLHFYIQSCMLLITLALAVQIPFDGIFIGYVVLIECLIGVYQMGMSLMLVTKLSKKTVLLNIHFFGSVVYLITLILLGIMHPSWMNGLWSLALYVFPWGIAVLFLVAIDELERKRNYRL